jgi:hypothetical protein
VFGRIKGNLGQAPPILAYRLVGPPQGLARVVWDAHPVVGVTMEQAFRRVGDHTAAGEADEWLRDQLAEGPVLVKTLQKEARAAGISWPTVERAKARLRARAYKEEFSGPWYWRRPIEGASSPENPENPKDSAKTAASTGPESASSPKVMAFAAFDDFPKDSAKTITLNEADLMVFDKSLENSAISPSFSENVMVFGDLLGHSAVSPETSNDSAGVSGASGEEANDFAGVSDTYLENPKDSAKTITLLEKESVFDEIPKDSTKAITSTAQNVMVFDETLNVSPKTAKTITLRETGEASHRTAEPQPPKSGRVSLSEQQWAKADAAFALGWQSRRSNSDDPEDAS